MGLYEAEFQEMLDTMSHIIDELDEQIREQERLPVEKQDLSFTGLGLRKK